MSSAPKKLRKQELPKKAAVSCGEKIDEKRLDTLKRELREIDRKISSANYSIDTNRLEIQMKNLAIAPKKVSLKSSEVRMNEAREAKIRFASASKAFSTFAKAVCEMKEYLELWKESKPIQMASVNSISLSESYNQKKSKEKCKTSMQCFGRNRPFDLRLVFFSILMAIVSFTPLDKWQRGRAVKSFDS